MADTLSLIIPVYQSDTLQDTLQAIAMQSALDRVAEIIVVGKQTFTPRSDLPQLMYISVTENPIPAHNRNIGAGYVTSDWICFIDSDCLPDIHWIEHIFNALTPDTVALAGAVDIPPNMSYWGQCDHLLGFEKQAKGIANQPYINYAATLNFCIRRDIFFSLGGFNVSFTSAGGEDREFGWRLEQAGYKIRFIQDAIVIHNHPRSSFQSAWQHIYHYGQVTAQFRLLHNRESGNKWLFSKQIAKIPGIGELAGIARIFIRSLLRFFRYPLLGKYLQYEPGMAVLDIAHTWGMIGTIRANAS